MGASENWQEQFADRFRGYDDDLVLLNPRRLDWDSSWAQSPVRGTPFYAQVNWEFDHQDLATLCVYYFAPRSASPITLLELGCYGSQDPKNVIVACSPEYYRYGNVTMFCERNNIEQVGDLEALIDLVEQRVIEAM